MNRLDQKTHTDIKRLPWIERTLPRTLHPYAYLARIDRPIGIWLLLLPALWSIALSTGGLSDINTQTVKIIALFIIGAILMRSAGCIINDLWDRDLDKQVERTRTRPLAAGDVTPKQATIFLCILLCAGLIILLQLNRTTIILGVLSLPLVAIYPLMKRITHYPQFILGMVFSFGALMGWTAVTGTLETPAILLYIAAITWTIGYDTIYAHQDIEDDALIGIKSTAILWQERSKMIVGFLYIITITLIFFSFVASKGLQPELALTTAPAYHMARQLKKWKTASPQSALITFKSNKITGILILLLCLT